MAGRIPTSAPLVLAAAPNEGGDVTIVSATTSVNVAETADLDDPLMLSNAVRGDLSGTRFAVGDLRSAQTVILGLDQGDVVTVPGVPLGITDEVAVTVQTRQRMSELRFTSPDGRVLGTIDVPFVQAGAVVADGDAVVVTDRGQVLQASLGAEDARVVGTLDRQGEISGGFAALGGRRVVVVAERGVTVLDDDGEVVATVDLDAPWRPLPVVLNPAQRCVVVLSESGTATMLDLESGAVLGKVGDVVLVSGWSIDGCTASLANPDGGTILRHGAAIPLDRDETVAAIAPAGDRVVVRGGDGQAWLRSLDDEGSADVAVGSVRQMLYAFIRNS
jgi:hypothetical protein